MPQIFSNGARAELDTSITADSVSLTVITGGNLFPVVNYAGVDTLTQSSVEDWFKLVLQDDDGYEIVYCYRHDIGSNNFLNLRRGQEGTVARPFATGTIVGLRPLAKDMADLVLSNQENKANLANKADKTGDISGNAGTATKLESARALSISGGVTAAAKNFDGTMPVDLEVTAIDVSKANQGTLPVERGGTGTTTSTGSGNVVLSDSPALTGIPTAPTAAPATNTVQVATTAFVQAATDNKVDKVAGKQLSTEDYTSTEKVKLGGIASGATANAPDADLRDRSTHTGTQPASTITGLGTAAQLDVTASPLDSTFGRIPRLGDAALSEFSQVTQRDFLNGTLVYTSITVEMQLPFLIEIKGNGYNEGIVKATVTGYIYGNNVIVTSGETNNRNLPSVNLFFLDGVLCFWFARTGYWAGFQFRVTGQLDPIISPESAYTSAGRKNLVAGVYDSTMPQGAVASVAVALRRYLFLEDAVGSIAGGSIIERGSNANGEYVRFADGTQICTAAIYVTGGLTTNVGGVYHTPDQVWTFPSGFISQPRCSGTEAGGVGGCWIARGLSTQTQITETQYGFSAVRGSSTNEIPLVALTAIGRWK